ncbi:HYC_CC_PP family protein [Polaribacter uvawellassae]|uniref:HYC_CC_PP family protein n=1 Tax=Polaribacter uvawellassae TaxID=3133495 RepID=UPI00321C3157
MKEFSHKILAVLMSFVVLFSTTSFAITKHYCGDTLIDTAVFNKAETCGMEMDLDSTVEGCSVIKENCCNDEQILIDGQDEVQIQFDKISFEQKVFIASFIYSYVNLFEGLDKNVSSFQEYVPPIVTNQIYKIDESYLI